MEALIFYSKKKNIYEYKRLREESQKYSNIKFFQVEDLYFPINIDNFLSFDVFYFYSTLSLKLDTHFFAKSLKENGKIVINNNLTKFRVFDKTIMYYYLKKSSINCPNFVKIYDKKHIDKIKKLNFPIVAKHILKHRGMGVYLIKDEKELEEFIETNEDKLAFYVFQEFINYKHDLRIIIIGDKILGAMERIPTKDFRANISQNGIGRPFEINKELKEVVYKIAKIFDLQIAGIDILIDKEGNYYVIDINREMQFRGFEKFTGKNVAKEIINYLRSLT